MKEEEGGKQIGRKGEDNSQYSGKEPWKVAFTSRV